MTSNTTEGQDVATAETDAMKARQTEAALRPAVDIFEDPDGITVIADMPGVSRESLILQVDNDSLTIEGSAGIDIPEGMQPLHAEVRSKRYQRSFSLSNELDSGAISANLKHGVLEVRIPKRAEVRPRRIEVRSG